MHYEDIWNLTINSSYPNSSPFYFLEVEVKEEPGSTLWKASTYTFKITANSYTINPVNLSSVEPIKINFIEDGWHEKMTSGGGLFPPGVYKITYRLIETTEGCTSAGKLISTTSINKSITALFPPSLLFPFNEDTLENQTPVFAWSPVLPARLRGISYTIMIAEIAGRQNAEQALINNRAFFMQDVGGSLTAVYPAANPPLSKGIAYAWQVIAKTPDGLLNFSEVWTFFVREDVTPDTISSPYKVFLSVKNDPAGPVYQVMGDYLFIRYEEIYNDAEAGLKYSLISTDSHQEILSGKIFPLAEQKGVNTYALDIRSLREGNFLFVITDEKESKGYVPFKKIIQKKSK